MKDWSEFKPTILFLIKFLGLYLSLNLLYGIYVTHYSPRPDPITRMITHHSAALLSISGWKSVVVDHPTKPTSAIVYRSKPIVTVYEGCNSLNVMIVFVVFLFSFGKLTKALSWFVPVGLAVIYLINILRIDFLFLVSLKLPHFWYFTHKYLFTAIIYFVVFLLWLVWLKKDVLIKRS